MFDFTLRGLAEMKEFLNLQKLVDDFCETMGCAIRIRDTEGVKLISSRPGYACKIAACSGAEWDSDADPKDMKRLVTVPGELSLKVSVCAHGLSSISRIVSLEGAEMLEVSLSHFLTDAAGDLTNGYPDSFDSRGDKAGPDVFSAVPVYSERQIVNILDFIEGMCVIMLKLGRSDAERNQKEEQLRLRAMELELLNEKLEFQRKQAEAARDKMEASKKALEVSEKNYRNLVGNIPAIVYRCETTPPWYMHYISEYITNLTGYPPEAFYKDGYITYAELVFPEDMYIVTGAIDRANEEGRPYEMEYRIQDSKQQVHWVFERGRLIRDEKGAGVYLDGVIMDITEKKLIQIERAEMESRFKGLFDHMNEGVAWHEVIYDDSGNKINYRIYDANQAYSYHTGIPLEEVIGKLATDVYGVDVPPYLAEFGGVAESGIPVIVETYFPPLERHFHISIFSHQKGHFVTVFLDVTEMKKDQENLKLAFEERKILINEIHHRVKNNLAAIIHLIDMQRDVVKDDETRDFLEVLHGQAFTMALIYDQLNQTRKLSRIEMSHYFEELVMNIATSLNRMDYVLTTVDSEEIWMDVGLATPCALIVNELVTNVYKYAFPPEVKRDRHLLVRLREYQGDYFLMVRDNGKGLPAGFNLQELKSSGLNLVRLWAVHQLGGTFSIREEEGVVVEITFCAKEKHKLLTEENE